MDFQLRITKYDPQYRDDRGAYKKDEWTAISDIGRRFDGVLFLEDEYKRVENAYVKAVFAFKETMKIKTLSLASVWNGFDYKDPDLTLEDGQEYSGKELERIIRLVLREKFTCHLISGDSMFVHFGFDYYMYIGTSKPCDGAVEKVLALGLFPEKFKSPYLEDE